MRIVLTACVLGLLLVSQAFGQDEDLPSADVPCAADSPAEACPYPTATSAAEAFLYLQTALGGLNEQALSITDINGRTVVAVQAQVNELQDLFAVEGTRPPETAYVESLASLAIALRLASDSADPAETNLILEQVQRDLQVKLNSARASLGSSADLPDTVNVVIKTKRGTATAKGYLIKCIPIYYRKYKPNIGFADLTNPESARKLSPGIYLVYAYKDGVFAGRETIDVTFDNGTTNKFDLPVTL